MLLSLRNFLKIAISLVLLLIIIIFIFNVVMSTLVFESIGKKVKNMHFLINHAILNNSYAFDCITR